MKKSRIQTMHPFKLGAIILRVELTGTISEFYPDEV